MEDGMEKKGKVFPSREGGKRKEKRTDKLEPKKKKKTLEKERREICPFDTHCSGERTEVSIEERGIGKKGEREKKLNEW